LTRTISPHARFSSAQNRTGRPTADSVNNAAILSHRRGRLRRDDDGFRAVLAVAAADNTIVESMETNNIRVRSVTITP
jgi:hypothetical protein